jgi:hypothetical protein
LAVANLIVVVSVLRAYFEPQARRYSQINPRVFAFENLRQSA